jgi:hypothetical protein
VHGAVCGYISSKGKEKWSWWWIARIRLSYLILELMFFGAVASYVVSLKAHIVMLRAVFVHVQVRLHLLFGMPRLRMSY